MLMLTSTSIIAFQNMPIEENENPLEMKNQPDYSAANPASTPSHGGVVFAEYVGATWCGPCMGYSSPSLKQLAHDLPNDFTYVSFVDSSPNDHNSIGRVNHIMTNSNGYPTTAFADASSGSYFVVGGGGSDTDSDGYADNQFDSLFTQGGNMVTPQDFDITVTQVTNGNNLDIEIEAEYLGTGTATVYVYAAVTEKICGISYDDGSYPHYCWAAWLTTGGNKNGAGGFQMFTLAANTPQTASWTVPANTASGGASNTVTVGALMSGTHATWNDFYVAANSDMGPLIDVEVSTLSVVNNNWNGEGFEIGDQFTVDTTVVNNGDFAYTDGGSLNIYHVTGPNQEDLIFTDTLQAFSSSGVTQSFQTSFDSNSVSSNVQSTSLRAELVGLVADKNSGNNAMTSTHNLDHTPTANVPVILSSSEIERGTEINVEVNANSNDKVDDLSTMTPSLHVGPAGTTDQWSSEWIVGTPTLRPDGNFYQFKLDAPDSAPAGEYDIKVSFIDIRGHVSLDAYKLNAFNLLNAKPTIDAYPIPTVKVSTSEKVSMIGHIDDAETANEDLVVTSDSSNFVAWHADTFELEVLFDQIPVNADGEVQAASLYLTVNDGVEQHSGTLLFNVIESGMPRWEALPSQGFDEGGETTFDLKPYLSDTDNNGNPSSVEMLDISILGTTHEDMLSVSLTGFVLNIEAIDDDVFGTTQINLRASDGVQQSDTTLVVNIDGINDAPTFDMTIFADELLVVGQSKTFDLKDAIIDVDDSDEEARLYTTISTDEAGALTWRASLGELNLKYMTPGEHTILIRTVDRNADFNEYQLSMTVVSNLPLSVVEDANEAGDILVSVENLKDGAIPVFTFELHSDIGLTDIQGSFQVCSVSLGICYDRQEFTFNDEEQPWTYSIKPAGKLFVEFDDEIKLDMSGKDANGFDREMADYHHWLITEAMTDTNTDTPSETVETELTDEEIDQQLSDLEEQLLVLNAEINLILDDEDPVKLQKLEEKEELMTERTELECMKSTSDCSSAEVNAGSSWFEGNNMMTLGLGGFIALLVVVLILLLFVKGRDSEPEWNYDSPQLDALANSTYGGAAPVFQNTIVPAGPPIPETGLPPGWTMEQWRHYGQNYLDGKL
jgi:thiol-disulfide isomerase/thioredoxin